MRIGGATGGVGVVGTFYFVLAWHGGLGCKV